jgi:hypothetical protein
LATETGLSHCPPPGPLFSRFFGSPASGDLSPRLEAEAGVWLPKPLAQLSNDLLRPPSSSLWGRFYETVSAEIYGKKANLVKFRFVIMTSQGIKILGSPKLLSLIHV